MALDFVYQPVRISVRFTQNYVENRLLIRLSEIRL